MEVAANGQLKKRLLFLGIGILLMAVAFSFPQSKPGDIFSPWEFFGWIPLIGLLIVMTNTVMIVVDRFHNPGQPWSKRLNKILLAVIIAIVVAVTILSLYFNYNHPH